MVTRKEPVTGGVVSEVRLAPRVARASDCSENPASPVIRARSCSGKRDGESSSRHVLMTYLLTYIDRSP